MIEKKDTVVTYCISGSCKNYNCRQMIGTGVIEAAKRLNIEVVVIDKTKSCDFYKKEG